MDSKKIGTLPLLFSTWVAWQTLGCGGSELQADSCQPTATECLSSQIGQICDSRGRWATFQCTASQVCEAGACAERADGPTGKCTFGEVKCLRENVGQVCQGDRWEAFVCGADQECRDGRCVSACKANERKCIADTVVQVCPADGSPPVHVECPSGALCRNGACVGSCTPNARSCSASQVVRECRADGFGYVENPCPNDGYCKDGRCAVDPSSKCYPGDGDCLDSSTALVCKADGSGYDSKACSSGTTCKNGACRGRVCASGSVECIPNSLSKAEGLSICDEDGNGHTLTFCPANQMCFQDYYANRAKCYSAPCSQANATCGDPEEPDSMPHSLNRCEGLATGHLGWVAYRCEAPAVCKEIDGLARCVSPCVPRTVQCGADGISIETCDEKGNWVDQSCNVDGGSLYCVRVPPTGKVVCGDWECSKLQRDATTYKVYGDCSGKQIRRCGEDGRLGPAVDCDYGECGYENSSSYGLCLGARL